METVVIVAALIGVIGIVGTIFAYLASTLFSYDDEDFNDMED